MRGWERESSSKNGAHPGMVQSACTWKVTAFWKRKTRLRMEGQLLGSCAVVDDKSRLHSLTQLSGFHGRGDRRSKLIAHANRAAAAKVVIMNGDCFTSCDPSSMARKICATTTKAKTIPVVMT
jgi:hypothetical protein